MWNAGLVWWICQHDPQQMVHNNGMRTSMFIMKDLLVPALKLWHHPSTLFNLMLNITYFLHEEIEPHIPLLTPDIFFFFNNMHRNKGTNLVETRRTKQTRNWDWLNRKRDAQVNYMLWLCKWILLSLQPSKIYSLFWVVLLGYHTRNHSYGL